MSETNAPIIVIKRIKKGGHGHHGGAWKVALADFVTAMMAFFMLLWLVGSTTPEQKAGISDYFQNPTAIDGVTGVCELGDRSRRRHDRNDEQRPRTRSGRAARRQLEATRHRSGSPRAGIQTARRAEGTDRSRDRRKPRHQTVPRSDADRHHERRSAHSDRRQGKPLDVRQRQRDAEVVHRQDPRRDRSGDQRGCRTRSACRATPTRRRTSAPTRAIRTGNCRSTAQTPHGARSSPPVCRRTRSAASSGLGSSVPFVKDDPLNPINRRISMIVLNKKAEEALTQEAGPALEAPRRRRAARTGSRAALAPGSGADGQIAADRRTQAAPARTLVCLLRRRCREWCIRRICAHLVDNPSRHRENPPRIGPGRIERPRTIGVYQEGFIMFPKTLLHCSSRSVNRICRIRACRRYRTLRRRQRRTDDSQGIG